MTIFFNGIQSNQNLIDVNVPLICMNANKAFEELCYWCRVGDVQNVDRLISTGVNLNGVDEFDNSPLFLASLCGHEALVRLLLKRGAVCDRDRYEGARCIYGALTDSIRNILLKYDISKAVDVKQPFATHISNQLKDNNIKSHDIEFRFQNLSCFKLHKFLIAARSPYFKQKLLGAWKNRLVIEMPLKTSSSAFEAISKFLYLVPVLHEINSSDYDTLKLFCRKLNLLELLECLEKIHHVMDASERSRLIAEYQFKFTESAREDLTSFLHEEIICQKKSIRCESGVLKTLRIPSPTSSFADVYVQVKCDPEAEKSWVYPCHRSILARCEYFKIMFSSRFWETTYYDQEANQNLASLPIITLPTSNTEVAEIILSYLYYDRTEIPWNLSIGVLQAADALLNDRLKTMAAISITQSRELLNHISIFKILEIAWETRMERLEHYVAEIIANKLDYYSMETDFKKAVISSSKRIQDREETDTIELIDDIRYYLLKKHNLDTEDIEILEIETDIEFLKNSGIIAYKEDLKLIDNLLATLGLEA